jgi:hypothetical protein
LYSNKDGWLVIHEPIDRGIRCLAVLAMLLAAATALSQGFAAQDTHEIGSYVLTEGALAKYTQAVKNLRALSQSVVAACKDDHSNDAAGEGNNESDSQG